MLNRCRAPDCGTASQRCNSNLESEQKLWQRIYSIKLDHVAVVPEKGTLDYWSCLWFHHLQEFNHIQPTSKPLLHYMLISSHITLPIQGVQSSHGSTSLVCKPIWWACAAVAVAVGGFGTFTASEGSLVTKVFAEAAKACERPWQQSKVVTRKHWNTYCTTRFWR